MSRLNRNITESSQCAIMTQQSDCCYHSNHHSVVTSTTTTTTTTTTSQQTALLNAAAAAAATRNGGVSNSSNSMFVSPRQRLEAMSSGDFDMLKPLLMFNIENIQTYRADCKYKKARK